MNENLKKHWPLIEAAAKKYGFEPELIGAVVMAESGGQAGAMRYEKNVDKYVQDPTKHKPAICSKSTEYQLQKFSFGLMQVMGFNIRAYNYKGWLGDYLDPEKALEVGCKHLARCKKRWPNGWDAVSAYNQGSPRKTGSGKYKNKIYVDHVKGFYEGLKSENPTVKESLIVGEQPVVQKSFTTQPDIGEWPPVVGSVVTVMKSKGYKFFDDGRLNIVGLRSNNPVSDSFDDYIIVLKFVLGMWKSWTWPITTDPGAYYLQKPMNVKGCAILAPGQYDSYKIDKHKGKYDALCQRRGPVDVYRDNNLDKILNWIGRKIFPGWFGINIHYAGENSIIVGKWSAGCQVFKRLKDWREFMALAYKHREQFGNRFVYTLFEQHDFFAAAKTVSKPQLVGNKPLNHVGKQKAQEKAAPKPKAMAKPKARQWNKPPKLEVSKQTPNADKTTWWRKLFGFKGGKK